jgi:hypothetical protein
MTKLMSESELFLEITFINFRFTIFTSSFYFCAPNDDDDAAAADDFQESRLIRSRINFLVFFFVC